MTTHLKNKRFLIIFQTSQPFLIQISIPRNMSVSLKKSANIVWLAIIQCHSTLSTHFENFSSAQFKNRFEVFSNPQRVTNQINCQQRIRDHHSGQELFWGLKMREEELSGSGKFTYCVFSILLTKFVLSDVLC